MFAWIRYGMIATRVATIGIAVATAVAGKKWSR